MDRDVITFKGDRDLWIDFVAKIKKEKKRNLACFRKIN